MDKKFNNSMLFIHYQNKNIKLYYVLTSIRRKLYYVLTSIRLILIFFNSIYLNIFLYVLY